MGVMFDGLLGDRTDSLMQDWVDFDKKLKARLWADGLRHEGHVAVLRANYHTSLRQSMYEYVKSLNDTALFGTNKSQSL